MSGNQYNLVIVDGKHRLAGNTSAHILKELAKAGNRGFLYSESTPEPDSRLTVSTCSPPDCAEGAPEMIQHGDDAGGGWFRELVED